MSDKDLYSILGVSKKSDEKDIKKAYRKLAMKYHPDRNPDDKKAEAKFKEVQEAYEILSDSKKRTAYDRFGKDAFKNGGSSRSTSFEDMGDIFGDIFKNAGFNPFSFNSNPNRPSKGKDVVHKVELSFEEAVFGKSLDLEIPRYEDCSSCDGSGASDPSKISECSACGGTGQSSTVSGFMRVVSTCSSCRGHGTSISDPCKTCSGQGLVKKTSKISVDIPSGVDNGSKMRVPRQGEAGAHGGPAGDLYLVLQVKPHQLFKREGNHILSSHKVSFTQLVLGGDIQTPTIHGDMKLSIPKGSQSGQTLRLKSQGVKDHRGLVGDHLVTIQLETPKEITPELEEVLLKLKELEC